MFLYLLGILWALWVQKTGMFEGFSMLIIHMKQPSRLLPTAEGGTFRFKIATPTSSIRFAACQCTCSTPCAARLPRIPATVRLKNLRIFQKSENPASSGTSAVPLPTHSFEKNKNVSSMVVQCMISWHHVSNNFMIGHLCLTNFSKLQKRQAQPKIGKVPLHPLVTYIKNVHQLKVPTEKGSRFPCLGQPRISASSKVPMCLMSHHAMSTIMTSRFSNPRRKNLCRVLDKP